MIESRVFQIKKMNKYINESIEYTHKIVDGNNIEPPYTEDHKHVPNITSCAYKFVACGDRICL